MQDIVPERMVEGNGSFGFNSSGSDLLRTEDEWINEAVIRERFVVYNTPVAAVLIALYVTTFLIGVIGNALVIYIFARNKHMRTVTNSFLVNLAVCDLLVVCLCMPFSVAMKAYDNWIYGNALCKVVTFSQGLAVSSSILTMAVISAERFYAIRRPLKARAYMSSTRIQRIVLFIWMGASLVALPLVFVSKEVVITRIYSFTLCVCTEEWTNKVLKHLYNFALMLVLYVAPVVFISAGYMQIGLNLWQTDALLHAGRSASESNNARQNLAGRRKVARMLFIMAALFAASWLPVHILGISLDLLSLSTEQLRHLHFYFLWLGHANSSINPVCYCIMSTSFKAALRVELRRLCCCYKFDFHRETFRSMSISLTVNTSNAARRNSLAANYHRVRKPTEIARYRIDQV